MLLATAAFSTRAADRFFGRAGENQLTRGNGIVLLLIFCVFLYYTIGGVLARPRADQQSDPYLQEVADSVKRKKRLSFTVSSLMTVGGLIALICGGRMTVIAAVNIARAVGISEAVIGLTIISFGTTLPELVTGIVAARRGEGDIAIGNVVGSNIFNLLRRTRSAVPSAMPVMVPSDNNCERRLPMSPNNTGRRASRQLSTVSFRNKILQRNLQRPS